MNPCQCMMPKADVTRLTEHYRHTLLEDFVPWWTTHSLDRECGGFYSCLERDGRIYADDKYTWQLARQTWMFSRLYNCCEQKPQWLEIARHGADFLIAHGFNQAGRLYFRLTREGKPLAERQDANAECFAAIALAEWSRCTGDPACLQQALICYDKVRALLGQPVNTPLLGYPLRGQFHLHAHDMIRLTVASVLNEISPDPRWEEDLTRSAESVIGQHWQPDLGVLLESIGADGRPCLDITEGRLVNPGHAIETAWMLMELASDRDDRELLEGAIDITLRSMERCWDWQYGGMRYLFNCDGSPTFPPQADQKLWWPHTEALYALLLAWSLTGRDDLAIWYNRVHDYAFSHFPDPRFGEWFGYLNRDGSVIFKAKANGWKGFYHVPRVFLRCLSLLSPTIQKTPTT